jgi:hypothetical protein
MNAKTKRPPVANVEDFKVNKPKTAPPVVKAAQSEAFRTSVYFHRAVHDKLRAIAFEERKTIMDLINEGLDHVLTSRHYPTISELRAKT